MLNLVIIASCLICAAFLMWPPVARAPIWRAALTPLASIIGSGFLILGPVLNAAFGIYSVAVMALLCVGAYAFGAAIRFNIRRIDGMAGAARSPAEQLFEQAASWALAIAYVISVAYYLNLLGSFAISLTDFADATLAKLITSGVYAVILCIGWGYGFSKLERLEQLSVGIKLSIIAGLLVGLAAYFASKAQAGALIITPAETTGWAGATLIFGLVVTVQGFETSRYLGETYSAAERIRSMKLAQGLATVIYVAYVLLLSLTFSPAAALHETAIINLMQNVAPVLPVLLVVAALSAQFSAALADTGGSGGLFKELTGGRMSARAGYALLCAVGLGLTWGTSVFDIIGYASRAFALYYALQSAIAAVGAWHLPGNKAQAAGFAGLALFGLALAAFGQPIE